MTDAPGHRGSYAIIPTHNRHAEVAALAGAMAMQAGMVVVIDNASTPPVAHDELVEARFAHVRDGGGDPGRIWLWRDEEQPPNLSRMWNAGLAAIADDAARAGYVEWDVAILNDDAVVPEGWFALVAGAMRSAGAAAACSLANIGHRSILKTEPDADIGRRLYGPAFIIRGELAAGPVAPLVAEERLPWWFQDTDLDWKARRAGGMLLVPGPHVPNMHANESTVGALAEQAGRDRETFREIWGGVPW